MKKKIAFAVLMGIVTTGLISFSLMAVNIGFTERFILVWFRAWALSYMISIPTILLLASKVQQLVDRIFDKNIIQKEAS